jgi:hypothetical protein
VGWRLGPIRQEQTRKLKPDRKPPQTQLPRVMHRHPRASQAVTIRLRRGYAVHGETHSRITVVPLTEGTNRAARIAT